MSLGKTKDAPLFKIIINWTIALMNFLTLLLPCPPLNTVYSPLFLIRKHLGAHRTENTSVFKELQEEVQEVIWSRCSERLSNVKAHRRGKHLSDRIILFDPRCQQPHFLASWFQTLLTKQNFYTGLYGNRKVPSALYALSHRGIPSSLP